MGDHDERSARKEKWRQEQLAKEEAGRVRTRVRELLQKAGDITEEEQAFLDAHSAEAKSAVQSMAHAAARVERQQEHEDPLEVLEGKLHTLADMVRAARHVIFYTGAGISTAANIPDYRGPQGIWTLLEKQSKPIVAAGIVKHVVSQNCDGLHVRSGLPRDKLSELHGNSFLEYCPSCSPPREYLRPYDVSLHSKPRTLSDSIVHFGETGAALPTINWPGALDNAKAADLIVCLGTSLKILKKYPLWGADRPASARPKLVIVNLQWTPKDRIASLLIRARADTVLSRLTHALAVPAAAYDVRCDPIALAPPGSGDGGGGGGGGGDGGGDAAGARLCSEGQGIDVQQEGEEEEEIEQQSAETGAFASPAGPAIARVKEEREVGAVTGWYGRGLKRRR